MKLIMKKSGMAITSIVVMVCLLTFFVGIPTANATGPGTPFGGKDIMLFPCTCAAGSITWHLFVPLFLAAAPTFGALIVTPLPTAYEYYKIHPGAWVLGFFTPGAGAGCFVGVEPYCVPLPNLGLITPFAGVSPD